MSKEQSQIEIISADSLKERLKQTFVGRPPQPSERRQYLQDLAFLRPSDEGLRVLTELPTTQLALVLPEEIVSEVSAIERTIEGSGASQEDILEARERAFQAFVWSQKPENSGKAFNFGPLRKPVEQLIAVFGALLLVLTLSLTACAADTNSEPIKPAAVLATGELPINGGGEGETAEPQRFAVFDSARNYRTGPSASSSKTQLDGKTTTTAGKEYEYFQRVVNSDGSVWIRLTPDGVAAEVWAVLVHPGLNLTGTELQPSTPQTEGGPLLTEVQKTALVADFNRVATAEGLRPATSLLQNPDDSILYLDADGKPVGTAQPVRNPQSGDPAARLFEIDSDGDIAVSPVAEDFGDGWESVTTNTTEDSAAPALPSPSQSEEISDTVPSIESSIPSFITEALQAQSPEQVAMNALLPENFDAKLNARGIKALTFDSASSLYIVTDKDGSKYYFAPQAAPCAEGDGVEDFENGFFMANADSWMTIKSGKATLKILTLTSADDMVLNGPLSMAPALRSGVENAASEQIVKRFGLDPATERTLTLIFAKSGTEIDADPAERDDQLKVFRSNDSKQRVFALGQDIYYSMGYMQRSPGTTEGSTYANLLKNYIAQNAPDGYITSAVFLTQLISRQASLLADFISGRQPSTGVDLLEAIRELTRNGADGFVPSATGTLKPRADIKEWM